MPIGALLGSLHQFLAWYLQVLLQLFFPPPPRPQLQKMASKSVHSSSAANADVEYANYKTFRSLCNGAKLKLAEAVSADEQRPEKTGVVVLYRRVMKELQLALGIDPHKCPANKREEIAGEQGKLARHLELVQDRLANLGDGRDGANNANSSVLPFSSRAISIVRPQSTVSRLAASVSASSSSSAIPTREKSVLLRNVNAKYGEEILTSILTTADTQMASVEGNEAAKLALEESVVLPTLNPQLFTGLRAPCKGILLFGPPGNGKTMLAKAVASECHSTFFNISAATIMSKWVGDGERMVQALFQVARNAQPAIIFIDEVDSMLCERSENENAAARRVKTEFLVQLDGCSGKSEDRILVLAATNRPQDLDEGILRRFPKRVFIDLPDRTARANMIRRTFDGTSTRAKLNGRDLDYLADLTEQYSYSDLDALCRAAALVPLRSIHRSMVPRLTASQLRPVNVDDFLEALNTVRPSLSDENRQKLLEFARRHAQISQ